MAVSDEKLQQIEGFGSCFNEMEWDALITLPGKERTGVLNNLFSPSEAYFTLNRMPMGASDYALSFYSFNDVADDFMPGAYRLKTNEKDDYLAFVNPDGKIVLIVVSREKKEKHTRIVYNNMQIDLTLKKI
jgi:O-glycosyl hydrolase